jgi:hypothetical protein
MLDSAIASKVIEQESRDDGEPMLDSDMASTVDSRDSPAKDTGALKMKIGSEVCCSLDDVQGHVKLTLQASDTSDGRPTLSVFTNVSGIVFFEWQVRLSEKSDWELPPPAWPPNSGANGQVLQTRLIASHESTGQAATLPLGEFNALRWQLWCLGNPMLRSPETQQEISLELDDQVKSRRMAGLFRPSSLWREEEGDVDSDDEGQGCAILKLQLQGECKKVLLPQPTLEQLNVAAEREFRGTFCRHEWRAVGRVDGILIHLDSDHALGLFLTQAAGCWIGAPIVELRLQEGN